MSLANKISLFRILLAPLFVASLLYYHPDRDGLRYVSLALFLIGILSDALDGFVARSKSQQSKLGAVLDPVADKFLILSALISLSTIHGLPTWMRLPAWFNLIVISRDALIIVGTLLLFLFTGKVTVQPSRVGKWAVAMQMCEVPTVLLRWPIQHPLLLVAATLTVCSGIAYVRHGVQLISE